MRRSNVGRAGNTLDLTPCEVDMQVARLRGKSTILSKSNSYKWLTAQATAFGSCSH
jgi:hypothetical protein